jgi:glycosyltransferase involved in cell wall biosynthesis
MIPDISVVCPCYNEEANVEAIAAAVIAELEKAGVSFEFIFIDNASADRTVEIVKGMCASDPRIKLIVNTRNFGQMRSPTHCIYSTSGRAVLGIAADFQDPPELIGPMIKLWRDGCPIVLGVREKETASPWLKLGRKIGYGFFGRFGDVNIVPGATGFGIYDQKVVQVVKQWDEPEPFFRAMLVESGFPIATVPHKRGLRLRGKSSNTLLPILDFSISALSGSARRLLRLPVFFGIASLGVAVLLLLVALVMAVLGRPFGYLLWYVLVEFNFAILFLFMGLIGDQIRLISERTRKTPLVVEKERVNFAPPAE